MPLSVVVRFGQKCLLESGLTYGNPLRGNTRWCFLLLWCVVSIGISSYQRGSKRDGRIWRHVILHLLWSCLLIPRCVNLVPFVGYSCRLILLMLGILIYSVWFSRVILMEFFIDMLSRCHFILQCHIWRRLTIVLLLVWQRLCCWLGTPWWWHVGGISSIVGDLGDAIVGAVAVSIFPYIQ